MTNPLILELMTTFFASNLLIASELCGGEKCTKKTKVKQLRLLVLKRMVFMSRRSLEAGILVAFAILAVGFASFFERNETSEVASEDISVSSESSVTDTQHCAVLMVHD